MNREATLAQRIGQLREAGRPLASDPELAADPLMQVLLRFQARQVPKVEVARQERIWQQVVRRMQRPAADRLPRAGFRRRRMIWRWALSVAMVLLAVGLGWWLSAGRKAEPVLVASAETAMQAYRAPDGSRVTLRPHSRLYQVVASETVLHYRLEGEAFFEVVPRPERRFQVEAGPVHVTVLGTRFNVRTWGGVEVFLEAGRLELQGPRGQRQVLTAGQRVRLTANGRLTAPERASAEVYLDWLQGRLTFAQQPAAQVVTELAYHFGVQITLPEPYAAQTLSGTLLLEDLEQALQDLGRVLGGHFVAVAPAHYRFEADGER